MKIGEAVRGGLVERRLPGAVVVIGHGGQVVFEQAYGYRAIDAQAPGPNAEPMTLDTIFDCASLTKVVATTACLMRLFDLVEFRLEDLVTQYIPDFQCGQSTITLRHLLTHFSGLAPDVAIDPEWMSYETGMRLACTTLPKQPPDQGHIYSDINFELLGEIVQRITGLSLAEFARKEVYEPLTMRDTMFCPPAALTARIAPTEPARSGEAPLRGVVHDPTARFMGGVAGHAGLFSTASDLSRFAQLMLNLGELDGVRVFRPETVRLFTTPQTPSGQPVLRGLGWDIDSPYSTCRGSVFPIGSYGHTGFTGTSMWIDPGSGSYVILLSNAVHVPDHGTIVPLRAQIASLAASALGVG